MNPGLCKRQSDCQINSTCVIKHREVIAIIRAVIGCRLTSTHDHLKPSEIIPVPFLRHLRTQIAPQRDYYWRQKDIQQVGRSILKSYIGRHFIHSRFNEKKKRDVEVFLLYKAGLGALVQM